jgi:hypothetical protein
MAHSQDLRVRVARAVSEGQSRRAAAQRFAVSASSAVQSRRRCVIVTARCSNLVEGGRATSDTSI